jgi:MFS family permease
MYYAVFLFQQAGVKKTAASLLANGLQGVVLNLFTYPNMYYMDKWGRRMPMVIGGVGMGIAMMIIGVLMKTTGKSPAARVSLQSTIAVVSALFIFRDLFLFFLSFFSPSILVRIKQRLTNRRKPRLRPPHPKDKL